MKIQKVLAAEILDSRGTPTVGATVILSDGSVGTANAPSGASTGKFEAHEKRDGDRKRYLGRGVKKAVEGIEETVAPVLENMARVTVQNVDKMLIELDNTKNKEKLGANAGGVACRRKGACRALQAAVFSLSRRRECTEAYRADDEYFKRRRARGE